MADGVWDCGRVGRKEVKEHMEMRGREKFNYCH